MSLTKNWLSTSLSTGVRINVYILSTAAALGVSIIGIYYVRSIFGQKKKLERVGEISKLFIYPIKSCRGIAVESAICTNLGLRNGSMRDRVFLLVTDEKRFVTARQEHKLLLVVPTFDGDDLVVNAPGMEDTLRISLKRLQTEQLGPPIKTKVWGTEVRGYDCGDEIALWFQRYLGKSGYRLLYYKDDLEPRFGKKSAYHQFFKKGDGAVFADLTPYLLLSEASIEDLNTRLQKPVTIINFRPNLTVRGCEPYDEDKWKTIKIGDSVKLRHIKPCPRCMMTTVDPNTAIRDLKEPLKTLKTYRKNTNPVLKKLDGETPCMGVGLAVDISGEIRVGDVVYAA